MMLGYRLNSVLAILLSLSGTTDAVRGGGGLPLRRDANVEFDVDHREHRRLSHWGGVVDDSRPVNPETRSVGSSNTGSPKGKKGGDRPAEDQEMDDPKPQEIIIENNEEKIKKGKQKTIEAENETTSNEIECDDPDDPLCNPQLVLDQVAEQLNNVVSHTNSGQENGSKAPADDLAEENPLDTGEDIEYTDQQFNTRPNQTVDDPTIMQRDLIPFKIAYALSGSLFENDLDDGDYAEVADSTELHLTQYFTAYYEGKPTNFSEVDVMLQKTEDPLIVRLFVYPSFAIPGNVPTMTNLFDRMIDAFSGLGAQEYLTILNKMGDGNPFKNTRSVALINETPVSVQGSANSEGSDGWWMDSNNPKFWTVIIGSGVLVLALGGTVWWFQQRRSKTLEGKHRVELDDIENRDILNMEKQAFSSKDLGSDTNISGYIQTIKKRFREDADDPGSSTDLEDTSHDPKDEASLKTDLEDSSHDPFDGIETNEATDGRQTPTAFQDTILQSLSSSVPPSVGDQRDDGEEDEQIEMPPKPDSQGEYMNYLSLNGSFEEEDLRS